MCVFRIRGDMHHEYTIITLKQKETCLDAYKKYRATKLEVNKHKRRCVKKIYYLIPKEY